MTRDEKRSWELAVGARQCLLMFRGMLAKHGEALPDDIAASCDCAMIELICALEAWMFESNRAWAATHANKINEHHVLNERCKCR